VVVVVVVVVVVELAAVGALLGLVDLIYYFG